MLGWIGVGLVLLTAVPSAGESPAGDGQAGRAVFEANCAMCHGADASGMMGMHPSLRGAVQRLSLEGVEVTIRMGRRTTPPMPAFSGRLSDQQIADVIAYIAALPEGPRNFGPGQGMMGSGPAEGGMAQPQGRTGVGVLDLLIGALLVGLIGLVAIALIRLVGGLRRSAARPSARDELDRRYARGELERDEYLQRRTDLER
jgi:mono/diheme cytochrome c family protein